MIEISGALHYDVTHNRSVTLNRPLITILEQLLVPTDAFVYLQESMILEFADALINEARAVAVLSAWSKLQLPYEDLSKAGFQLTLDPFFRSLLLAVYRNAVAGLRYKTCIALPVDRGRNMLGVVDTTNKLRYGEAFVQSTEMRSPHVQHKGPPKKTVITSTVLVTKCPFLHRVTCAKSPRSTCLSSTTSSNALWSRRMDLGRTPTNGR
ncbi:hypothetical protein HPB51_022829 [Rhipicephalus microplus]|uniref:RNA-dependent RNA polymerase n=1 Tax=Rhipicephalus microplus TaxID=6941 RepID=A0A9J6DD49_RHIMP|nr:hypothetical protein HPB51_022829 [Rhipicephalus microplus]